MNKDISILEKLASAGLTEKEAAIYLALIKKGSSTATEISEMTEINRATAYPVLESLEAKGLVTPSSSLMVTKYSANSLVRYRETMRSNVDRYRRLRREVEDSVQSLRKQYASDCIRPKIMYFSGITGMKRAFEAALNSKEKYMRVASSARNIMISFPAYLPQYILKRLMNGVVMKGMHPDDPIGRALIAHPIYKSDVSIAIPESMYHFEVDIAIYDDIVGYTSHAKLYSVGVHSRAFSLVMKNVFDLAWSYASRFATARLN